MQSVRASLRVPCRKPALLHARQQQIARAIPSSGAPNSFLEVCDEESFFAAFKEEIGAGKIPEQLFPLWKDFFQNYKTAILSADLPTHDIRLVAEVQASIADTVINQLANPYTFPSFHRAITEPYDYFEFGQRYVGSLINFEQSYLGHRDRFELVQKQLDAGENVIVLANHQSEADPGIWAHMLAHSHPDLAKRVIYVAGDRVVSDPLCVPFSMGRNLFCVHSRRHMDDNPATKAAKQQMNRRTLMEMSAAMAAGGCLLWIAPAGGRDRPDKDGVFHPAPFDAGAVELMRALASKAQKKAGVPSHLFPFAMYSAPLMPPPKAVEKGLGERRMVNFTGVGISMGEEIDADGAIEGLQDKQEIAAAITKKVFGDVTRLYAELDGAIKDPSTAPAHFCQPWLEASGSVQAGAIEKEPAVV